MPEFAPTDAERRMISLLRIKNESRQAWKELIDQQSELDERVDAAYNKLREADLAYDQARKALEAS